MKIDPRHLEILSAIVDEGGVTEGASALGKAQPSVSRTLAMLEERIGMPLFEKGRRPLRPTEICLALASEGRKIRLAGKTAGDVVASFSGGKAGVIRVGGTPLFMDGVVSHMIAKFQLAYPAVRIDQSYGFAEDLMRQLRGGSMDLGITPMEPDAVSSEFDFEQILPGRNVVVCGVTHPLTQKSSLRLSEIANYPWIAPPANSPLYQDLRLVLNSIGVTDFKVAFSGGSLASIVNILSQSDSLTILPLSVVFMLRRQNLVSALSIRIGHPKRNLGMLTLKGEEKRPSVLRFKRFIRDEFAGLAQTIARHEQNALWRS